MSPDELKMDRQALIETFLDKSGWRGAKRWRLAGDASFRKYDRVEKDGRRAVLMDTPPPQEDVRPFVSIARHLHARGFSQSELVLRMTREEIGSYLGLKLETVSRTFSKFVEDGIVEVKQRHVRILNTDALQRLVNHQAACH